jgi:hypothetical protein
MLKTLNILYKRSVFMLNLKKGLFLIGFLMFLLNVYSQTNSPIIGYDKVPWGASVQTVTQAYPAIREATSLDASVGIKEYYQRNVGNGIEERRFFFYNNRLYKVAVTYEDQRESFNAFMALATKLVDIYGKFDNQSNYSNPSGNNTLKFIDFIRYYNKDLSILLRGVDVVNRYNNVIENYILCIYSNPNTEIDIEAAKRKQKENSFGL